MEDHLFWKIKSFRFENYTDRYFNCPVILFTGTGKEKNCTGKKARSKAGEHVCLADGKRQKDLH